MKFCFGSPILAPQKRKILQRSCLPPYLLNTNLFYHKNVDVCNILYLIFLTLSGPGWRGCNHHPKPKIRWTRPDQSVNLSLSVVRHARSWEPGNPVPGHFWFLRNQTFKDTFVELLGKFG